jgi:hypothetical protein
MPMSDKGRRTMKRRIVIPTTISGRPDNGVGTWPAPTIALSLPVQPFLNFAKIETSHEIAP